MFKPATSKAGNSEVYVIAVNYRASQPLEQFTQFLGMSDVVHFITFWLSIVRDGVKMSYTYKLNSYFVHVQSPFMSKYFLA